MTLIMSEDSNFQDEINTILDTTKLANSDTATPIQPAVTQPSIQPAPVQAPPAQPYIAQQPIAPVQPNVTQQPITPQPIIETPQQSYEIQTSNVVSIGTKINEFVKKHLILLVLSSVGILIILALFLSRTSLGPVSFKNCTEIEGSTVVKLEPEYCVTPEGDVFFKNKNEEVPVGEGKNTPESFDPNNPPATILPEI
jgi:hypothetical protein